jgi:hypothetical protein
MSDTPKTDAAELEMNDPPAVHADFARALERENAGLLSACEAAEFSMRALGGNKKQSMQYEAWVQLRSAIAKARAVKP